jgi:hypothetical protein
VNPLACEHVTDTGWEPKRWTLVLHVGMGAISLGGFRVYFIVLFTDVDSKVTLRRGRHQTVFAIQLVLQDCITTTSSKCVDTTRRRGWSDCNAEVSLTWQSVRSCKFFLLSYI